MWLVATRAAIVTILCVALVIFGLHFITTVEINRLFYIWLGIFGVILVGISLGYIPVKYWLRSLNRLQTWLTIHMAAGGIGAVLILLHSELRLKSLLPAITLVVMELVAFTGLIGRYLFLDAAKALHRQSVINKAVQLSDKNEDEYILLVLSMQSLRPWRKLHVQLSWLLLALTVIHVITEFVWRGLRL